MRSYTIKGFYGIILVWMLSLGVFSVFLIKLPKHVDEKQTDVPEASVGVPTDAYEKIRRQLELDMKELWYSVRGQASSVGKTDFDQIQDIYRLLRSHLQKLRQEDGYETYREQETTELSRIIQKRIHDLQNPADCDKAKKVVCFINKGCGFGCQIHHVAYCMVVAYATGRTLILESNGWTYNRAGWEEVFMPVSQTCKNSFGLSRAEWTGSSDHEAEVQVLTLPIIDYLYPLPPFLPIAIPSDIAGRLEKVHGEPQVWWVGQFVTFLLRVQPQIQSVIDEAKSRMDIRSPTVGVHIRRTDKLYAEASFHSLSEYMRHVEEYFAIREKIESRVKKRVFIASDDPGVISEATRTYASNTSVEWQIMGDISVAESASISQRNTGLIGVIKDVFLLAECDFVVCTFSSQVCRLAYEIMQTKYADASGRFVSLDDIYYYGGGLGTIQKVEFAHKPRNSEELELEVGDLISTAGNHWDGMSKGTNQRTQKEGLYPSYKARIVFSKVNFPHEKSVSLDQSDI